MSDLNNEDVEQIEAVKYMTEHCEDPVHQMGYNTNYNFFVGFPYNIIITYQADSSESKQHNNKIFVKESFEPKNKYSAAFGCPPNTSELYPVKINKKWILECYNMLDIEKTINLQKTSLFNSKPTEKVPIEIYNENMLLGHQIYRKDKEEGKKYFLECLKIKPNDKNSFYNLACCFAGVDNDQAFDYLEKSIEAGFDDYRHASMDYDLNSLKTDPTKYNEIIEKMRTNKIKRETQESQ